MKNLIKTALLLFFAAQLSACSTTNIDQSKQDVNVKNNFQTAKFYAHEKN
jgi:hypothetical protein